MKKAVVILLMLIYGTATMGATVHLHYCMDKFVGWSLLDGKDDKCGRCGMEEKDKGGCCKDEHKHFKLKLDQQKSNAPQQISFFTTPVLVAPVVEVCIPSYTALSDNYTNSHAPPGIVRERLHILYSVFLI